MKSFKIKILHIYIPYLLLAIGTLAIYNFGRWYLDVYLRVLEVNDDWLNIFFPMIVTYLVVYIGLRNRLRSLRVTGKRENGHFYYQIILALSILAPLIISQYYISQAFFDLKKVEKASAIQDLAREKYFEIRSYKILKEARTIHVTSKTSGRHKRYLTYYMYIATPFQDASNVWLGIEYKKKISNRLSAEEKEMYYETFVEECEQAYEQYRFYNGRYFEMVGPSYDRVNYRKAIQNNIENTSSDPIVLKLQEGAFEKRLGTTFPWIWRSLGLGWGLVLLMVLIPKINQRAYKRYHLQKSFAREAKDFFQEYLNPYGKNPVTAILLLCNIGVFLILLYSGLHLFAVPWDDIMAFGGVRRVEVFNGEVWRLFTAMFIHGGIAHLVMNMFGLALAMIFLEHIMSPAKLIGIYIVCGLSGNLMSVLVYKNAASVGASGAIFGLYGLLFAFFLFDAYRKERREFSSIYLLLFAVVNLFLGFFLPGIDNAAHLGGFCCGLAIGYRLAEHEHVK